MGRLDASRSEDMQSVEGPPQDPRAPKDETAPSLRSSAEHPVASQGPEDDPSREEHLEALFRELGGGFSDRTLVRRIAWILLGSGLVLVGVGLAGAVVIRAPELFLSLILAVNILAVLCVAVGILLLPERPTPGPPARDGVGGGGWGFVSRTRLARHLPHVALRRARH